MVEDHWSEMAAVEAAAVGSDGDDEIPRWMIYLFVALVVGAIVGLAIFY